MTVCGYFHSSSYSGAGECGEQMTVLLIGQPEGTMYVVASGVWTVPSLYPQTTLGLKL